MGRKLDDATNARRIRRTRGVIFFLRLLATDLLPRFLAALDFAAVLAFVEEVWARDIAAEDNNIVPESERITSRNNRRQFTTKGILSLKVRPE
jgi:hypothetical protein